MKISEVAEACNLSVETLRFYEKQRLVDAPQRGDNGYRRYGPEHVARVRFIRSAQSLGFTLAQIADLLPRLAGGQLGRADIEQQLRRKMTEIDAQIGQLKTLKTELRATLEALACPPGAPVLTPQATRVSPASPRPIRINRLLAR